MSAEKSRNFKRHYSITPTFIILRRITYRDIRGLAFLLHPPHPEQHYIDYGQEIRCPQRRIQDWVDVIVLANIFFTFTAVLVIATMQNESSFIYL